MLKMLLWVWDVLVRGVSGSLMVSYLGLVVWNGPVLGGMGLCSGYGDLPDQPSTDPDTRIFPFGVKAKA